MQVISQNYIFDWNPEYPFLVAATRYVRATAVASPSSSLAAEQSSSTPTGITAIFAHGTGFHKEQWEHTIRSLFELDSRLKRPLLREAWSIDCPNHGQSYMLNEKFITECGYTLIFPWDEYTKTLYLFLTQNKEFDFSTHQLVAIGHSMGAVCLTLTRTYPRAPEFTRFVLCEPMVVPTDFPEDHPLLSSAEKFISSASKRQDIWSSFDDVRASLQSKRWFQAWDKQVLDSYLKFGFRGLPTSTYPHTQGVTLACPKQQEAACYRDRMAARRVFQYLPVVCAQTPVHIIWGAIDDSVASEVKKRTTDPATGRKMASVQRIEGVGHLIVQVAPFRLAEAILNALSAPITRSRL